ncbi:MAG: alpha/beta hydrolase [Lachnospiraceae bacterium]|nr:alpha/beta hydrolase [Lachnospiraceae bacterium]
MKKRTFKFSSADKKTKIYAVKWEPKGEIKGILQISHGMVEYVERYEKFAEFMTQQGFMVVGNDHLGHGNSVTSPERWGYFAPERGSDIVVKDLEHLRSIIQREYPGLPYFFLGHSMGSFMLRKYLSKYSAGLHGAIIMGTGNQSNGATMMGKAVCRILAVFRGWEYRSKLVDKLVFSGNNKRFQKEPQANGWLTKDKEIVKAYNSDPKCTFHFTLNGFYNLFDTIYYVSQPANINGIPRNLPILLVSGKDDPVGNYGAGVKAVYETYKRMGIKDITYRLYPGDRHEILNELDKEQVYEDIYQWIQARI